MLACFLPWSVLVARGREREGVQRLPTMKRPGEEVFFLMFVLYIYFMLHFKKNVLKQKTTFQFLRQDFTTHRHIKNK